MARDGDEYNSDREREQRLLDRQTGWKPMASDPTREALERVAAGSRRQSDLDLLPEVDFIGGHEWHVVERDWAAFLLRHAALSTTPAPLDVERLARAMSENGQVSSAIRQYATDIAARYAAIERTPHECDDPECYGPSDTRCGTHNCTCHCHRSTP